MLARQQYGNGEQPGLAHGIILRSLPTNSWGSVHSNLLKKLSLT